MVVNACLIGVSGFGAVHYADVLRECKNGYMNILGVCVINQEEESEKCEALRALGATLHTDYQEMLTTYKGQIQLCMIPTGIPLHRPMTIAALEAGANVFVEKPAAGTIDDVDAMIAAEAQAEGFVAVGYQSMYNAGVHEMKQALLDGVSGEIKEIRCKCLGPRMDSYYARNAWAGRVSLDGTWVLDAPFSNAFSHFITLLLFFAGSKFDKAAQPITMDVELYRGHKIESCDTSSWKIDTDEDVCLRFYTSHCSDHGEPQTFEMIGTEGRCSWAYNYSESQAQFFDKNNVCLKTVTYAFNDRPNIYQRLYQRIADNTAFVCDLGIARLPVLCSNAAFMAAPIETIDDHYIKRVELDSGEVQTIVAGMQEAVAQAFEQGEQLSAVNDTWAREGSLIDLEGLTTFTDLPLD